MITLIISAEELEMLKNGLEAYITECCVYEEDRELYQELLEQLEEY